MAKKFSPKPIQPKDALGQIGAELRRIGFRCLNRSRAGSYYFMYPGETLRLRLSDHRYSRCLRRRNVHVGHDEVIRKPITVLEIPTAALEIAIRYTVKTRALTGKIRAA